VSFKLFCVLFFVLGLYFDQAYFLDKKFLPDSRWRQMSKTAAEKGFGNIFAFSLLQRVFIVTSKMTRTHLSY
jgi:hypothetical protein